MVELDRIVVDMQNQRADGVSWSRIGLDYGINKAMARLIAGGYKPGHKVAKILNVQCYELAPTCHKCGKVHVTKRCTDKTKPRRPSKWVRVLGHAGWEER
jgi:hypothetical protein